MSFAVMSIYKYISKPLYDQSFMLCMQIINNMEMYRGVSTSLPPPPPPPPCRLQCLTIRRTFNCKVFTASKDERNIFEMLLNYTHINKDIDY